MCPDHSYIMLNLDWNQRKMQEKYIFQTVPEHEKHRLSRALLDIAWLCSRVEPQKEREKLSFDQVCVWVYLMAWAFDPSTASPWSAVYFKKTADLNKVYLEPAIWSRDTGERIPCFGQVSIDPNIDVHYQRCML